MYYIATVFYMKICKKCETNKTIDSFYKRKTGDRAGEYYEKCISCYQLRGRTYYAENRVRQLELAKKRKVRYIEQRKIFINKLKNKPCFDCHKRYPSWMMDFDHLDPKEKISSISSLTFQNMAKLDKIIEEIKKCDLVCSNCHRNRTYKRSHIDLFAEVANVVKAPL